MKGVYFYPNPAFERALKRFRKKHKEFYKTKTRSRKGK